MKLKGGGGSGVKHRLGEGRVCEEGERQFVQQLECRQLAAVVGEGGEPEDAPARLVLQLGDGDVATLERALNARTRRRNQRVIVQLQLLLI